MLNKYLWSALLCCLFSQPASAGTDSVCMIARRNSTTAPGMGCLESLDAHKFERHVEECDSHSFWNTDQYWENPDHCVNGCAPCLARAIALGADAAACNRRVKGAFCSVGYAPHVLAQLRSVACPHGRERGCEQRWVDMRADLLLDPDRRARAPPTPADELEELVDLREGAGRAENRMRTGSCARTHKDVCNEGHSVDGSGTDVLAGWRGSGEWNPPVRGWSTNPLVGEV